MSNDLISSMLVQLKNVSVLKYDNTLVPYSKLNLAILNIFKKEGFIKDYEFFKDNNKNKIKVLLKYKGWWTKRVPFTILKRISKPSCRVSTGYTKFFKIIPELKLKQGIAIISTSSGVMTHLKAINLKKGGEILCYIE